MNLNVQFLRNIDNQFLIRYQYQEQVFWLMPRWGIWWRGDAPNRYFVKGSPEEFILDRKIEDLTLWKDKWSLLAVVLTNQCRGKCVYCYADEVRKETGDTVINDEDIQEYLCSGDYKVLQWFGGEPVLEIDRIISYLIPDSIRTIEIVTGLKVDDYHFEKLLNYMLKDDRVYLTISCDPISDLDTWTRGSVDEYRELLKKLQIIAERVGVSRFSLRITLTRYGYDLVSLFNDIYQNIDKEIYWGIGVVHGAGRQGFWLLPEHKTKVSSFISNHVDNILDGRVFVVPNPISSAYNFYLWQLNAQKSNDVGLVWISMGLCGFYGRGGKTIRWDGQQCVCPEEATKLLSSVDIMNKLKQGVFIFTECLSCDWLVSCGGLCLWNRPVENQQWCWLRQLSIVYGFALAFIKNKLTSQSIDNIDTGIVLTCG